MKTIILLLMVGLFQKTFQPVGSLPMTNIERVVPGPDCYTIASGNFNDTAIWFNGIVPGITNKCTISANTTVTMTQNHTVRIFDFGSQGKLIMNNFTLFINGN